MYTLGHQRNGFVATHALEHMIYSYTLLVPIAQVCSPSQVRRVT